VILKASGSKNITFHITFEDLKFYNEKLEWDYEPGEFEVYVGVSSSNLKETIF